jgi:molybdate transport system substrate-binding protein
MATKQLLAALAAAYQQRSGQTVAIAAMGGVDAARRVQDGEVVDVVLLASDAIDKLIASGHVLNGSRVDLARSAVAVAGRAGAQHSDISTEDALRTSLLAAGSVGYSTGPSGAHLARLFERWGLADRFATLAKQAPPGVPVAQFVARGEVVLGVQQLSELMDQPGVEVLGLLPPGAEFITTFSAGLCPGAAQAEAASAFLRFVTSPEAVDTIRRHGMEPA